MKYVEKKSFEVLLKEASETFTAMLATDQRSKTVLIQEGLRAYPVTLPPIKAGLSKGD